MTFDPAFSLLQKFTAGLPQPSISEEDVFAASAYLGVVLPKTNHADHIKVLEQALLHQNGFLSYEISSPAIFDSDEYRQSKFVREVVANNRRRLQNPGS